jgi:hypothetical protein
MRTISVSSSDILDRIEKCDDARSILRQEHDEFNPGFGPPESNNPTSNLIVFDDTSIFIRTRGPLKIKDQVAE